MYFLEVVSTSAGLIKPASTVSEMMREATEDSFLFNSKRSYIYQMITFLYYSIFFSTYFSLNSIISSVTLVIICTN